MSGLAALGSPLDLATDVQAFDACVHPFVAHADDLRAFLPAHLSRRLFPGLGRHFYPPPISEFRDELRGTAVAAPQKLSGTGFAQTGNGAEVGWPGSDPEALVGDLRAAGVSRALLVPLTRGQIPDLDVANAICSATNSWLVERWLDPRSDGSELFGSMRVNPDDVGHAVEEIGRWSSDPRFLQVAVPMQSREPYGHRRYHPVWEAAARAGLPVAVVADRAVGAEFAPTFAGYPTHFIEYAVQGPLRYIYHLISLLAEGVFDRVPDARFVFPQGGADLLLPILWRLDKEWRPSRPEIPWLRRRPLSYIGKHVRLGTSGFEGPRDDAVRAQWLRSNDITGWLLHASGYPFRDGPLAADLGDLPDKTRQQVLSGNALEWYGLTAAADSRAVTGGVGR